MTTACPKTLKLMRFEDAKKLDAVAKALEKSVRERVGFTELRFVTEDNILCIQEGEHIRVNDVIPILDAAAGACMMYDYLNPKS